MGLATRYIGLEIEAERLKSAHAMERKRAEELEAKLEEAELAMRNREEQWEKEKSEMTARDAVIRQRLEHLNASLTKRTGVVEVLLEDQKVDPTLDALRLLEANNSWARNLLNSLRKTLIRLREQLLPEKPLADDYSFEDLANNFSSAATPNPVLEFCQAQRQAGVEVVIAMTMAHGEPVDWKKIRSAYPKESDGKKKSLQPFIRDAKRLARDFLATAQPAKKSSSAAPSASTATPEVP